MLNFETFQAVTIVLSLAVIVYFIVSVIKFFRH